MKIDMHVHIVGTGAGGTGCWLRSGGWRTPMEHWMCRHIGLPPNAFQLDFDTLYVNRLVEMVRDSSLDAAAILAMDQVHDPDGTPRGSTFYVPNDYVFALAGKYPEFLPVVSIHPARKDAMDELEKCLEQDAVMLKLLPNCHNVDCGDRRYRRFWERMAEARLPLLAHTGGEHTVPVINARFADPRTLEFPLQCGVTVIAAHCATRSGLFDPDYLPALGEMMGRFPGLYADNSALNIPLRSSALRPTMHAPFVERLVHGSDFPVLVYGHWAWMRGLINRETLNLTQREKNIIERDAMIKRAAGVPEAVFERGFRLLRRAA